MRVVTAALVLLGAHASAEDTGQTAAERPCKAADLTGTYVQIEFRETPEAKEAQWYRQFPNQYLAFLPDNGLAWLDSSTPYTSTDTLKSVLVPAKMQKYTLDQGAVLNLYTGDIMRYSYRCMVSLSATGVYHKGDLIFTGYTKERRTELYRHYRRWF